MPIRTREECHSTYMNSWDEYTGRPTWFCQTVEIRDWKIQPPILNKPYTLGGTPPPQLFFDITFPELAELYPTYKNLKYVFRKVFTGIDFVQLSNPVMVDDVIQNGAPSNATIYVDYQNFGNLTPGRHEMVIIVDAYGITFDDMEVFIESSTLQNVKIPISIDVSGVGIVTDKEEYNFTYNKAGTGIFSGDYKILVYTANPLTVAVLPEYNYLQCSQATVGSNRELTFQKNYSLDALSVGTYNGEITVTVGSLSKDIPINVTVIDDSNQFYVDPDIHTLSIQKSLSEFASAFSTITNPNDLPITISSFPNFIENVVINNGKVEFNTKNSSVLVSGNYSGDIVLVSGPITKIIKVNLSVMEGITHDFSGKPFYFAKDPNKFSFERTTTLASYLKMTLKMFFKGYDSLESEEQVYTVPFFQGKVILYPGDEVQDFFLRAKNVIELNDPSYLFDLANVSMTFEEMSENNIVLSTFVLNNIKFAPGKTPKAFPYWTDYTVRRTYSDSRINISFARLSNPTDFGIIKAMYSTVYPTFPVTAAVDQYPFHRNLFLPGLNNEVIQSDILTLLPFPDPQKRIHILWENQNLVFDWFTAQGNNYVEKPEIENITGQSFEYEEEKFDSKVSRPFVVNTGWLLKEEIDLITDLLASRLCFVYIDGQKIKAFPIGKKNEMKNDSESTYCMDLEFKTLIDER